MDLGSPWAGWQFALTHNTLSSGKMLSTNGYLKCIQIEMSNVLQVVVRVCWKLGGTTVESVTGCTRM